MLGEAASATQLRAQLAGVQGPGREAEQDVGIPICKQCRNLLFLSFALLSAGGPGGQVGTLALSLSLLSTRVCSLSQAAHLREPQLPLSINYQSLFHNKSVGE